MVAVFREVRRVLRKDGTLWLNAGDCYAGSGRGRNSDGQHNTKQGSKQATNRGSVSGTIRTRDFHDATVEAGAIGRYWMPPPAGLKCKDLVGMPWRLAFALQADGWWLRRDIIWCLSGGTWLYAKTRGGETLMTVKDLARLAPESVQLWNGARWTRLLGMSRSARLGTEIEIVLRSGDRISCSPTHRFPTQQGLAEASALRIGDKLLRTNLPEPSSPRDCVLDEDAAWFAGLYLAEGSHSEDTIQIAGHAKEEARWDRIQYVARKYGGYATRTVIGNCMNIRLYGKILRAIVSELVSGRTAHDKGIASVAWRYSNSFISALAMGYLEGDGHWDAKNRRWVLGFTRNYNLERDLRAVCARLGWTLKLKFSSVAYRGRRVPTFRGEIRTQRSGHGNERDSAEIVELRKARCRELYDIGVADEPHVFALASGILTHNSKPNPMPESVKDRPTSAHEYVFLFSKSLRYFYDDVAVRETGGSHGRGIGTYSKLKYPAGWDAETGYQAHTQRVGRYRNRGKSNESFARAVVDPVDERSLRSVWTIPTEAFPGAHFATFPTKLVEPCIMAGTSEHGCCFKCGAPWKRVIKVGYNQGGRTTNGPRSKERRHLEFGDFNIGSAGYDVRKVRVTKTIGWRPTCECGAETVPCVVLDPFMGSGTTALVALKAGRKFVGVEISPVYAEMARRRIAPELDQLKLC